MKKKWDGPVSIIDPNKKTEVGEIPMGLGYAMAITSDGNIFWGQNTNCNGGAYAYNPYFSLNSPALI